MLAWKGTAPAKSSVIRFLALAYVRKRRVPTKAIPLRIRINRRRPRLLIAGAGPG
jgi:hypothetical protein